MEQAKNPTNLDPDVAPWCLLTLEFHPSCASRFVTFPLLLQKANPAPALGAHSHFQGEKRTTLGISSQLLQLPQSQAGSLSPVFEAQQAGRAGPCAKVTSSHLCPHLYFSTCRASPQFQGEHPTSLSTAGTRGCVIRLSLPELKGRAQPCLGPAG